MNYIKSISVNQFDGAFVQTLVFTPGLNIISGVNGTGKTTVLKDIKAHISNPQFVQTVGAIASNKVLAFSPKRNAEKRNTDAIFQFIRQNNRRRETVIQEAFNKLIVDNTFEKYESLGDIFVYDFEDKGRSGTVPNIKVMENLTKEYNDVIKNIFPDYKLVSEWNSKGGSAGIPELKLITKYGIPLDLSVMSCGESEILALIFNVYFNRVDTDVYLIDEPEVHLNWSLEKGLFTFLDSFATSEGKQIIVTTHSRIIFDDKISGKTQFLVFDRGKIVVKKSPPTEYIEEIAGETAAIINITAPQNKTFFVEDNLHKLLVSELLDIYKKTAEVIIIKDASGMIKNLYKLIRSNPDFNSQWVNAYLMIDSDGQEPMYKTERRFIHLERFCAESYFFSMEHLATALKISETDLKKEILDLMKSVQKSFSGSHFCFIQLLLDKLKEADLSLQLMSAFDCSRLYAKLLSKKGVKKSSLLRNI